MKSLIGEIDAQLLQSVHVKSLTAEYVEDAQRVCARGIIYGSFAQAQIAPNRISDCTTLAAVFQDGVDQACCDGWNGQRGTFRTEHQPADSTLCGSQVVHSTRGARFFDLAIGTMHLHWNS